MSELPWRILAQLEIATLERQANTEFRMLGESPAWLQAVDTGFSQQGWRRADLHPSLQPFMIHAEKVWGKGHAGRSHSVAWKESAASGELYLQATALLVGARELLLVERVSKTLAEVVAAPGLAGDERSALGAAERVAEQNALAVQQLALGDPLTALYNRSGFEKLAHEQLVQPQRNLLSHWLLVIRMENFDCISSTLGSHIADTALQRTASLLRGVFRQTDIIGRLEGEEFAVLAQCDEHAHREILLERMSAAMLGFNSQEDIAFPLAVSVGVAWFDPDSPASLKALFNEAGARTHVEKRKNPADKRRAGDLA